MHTKSQKHALAIYIIVLNTIKYNIVSFYDSPQYFFCLFFFQLTQKHDILRNEITKIFKLKAKGEGSMIIRYSSSSTDFVSFDSRFLKKYLKITFLMLHSVFLIWKYWYFVWFSITLPYWIGCKKNCQAISWRRRSNCHLSKKVNE